MNGEILIENLVVNCIIGILSHERATPQRLRLDVVLQTDFSASAASDRVEDTVNYAQIADELTQLAVEGQFWLVEAFTAAACRLILDNHSTVSRISISARKPDVMPGEVVVGARLELTRD
ncbi:MAG: dihydroneopterin aldolase [Immundisolibacteraceae bacterium]|nr:dihydroneopterin aldolase [Immundisolibacteraceae bacterium]